MTTFQVRFTVYDKNGHIVKGMHNVEDQIVAHDSGKAREIVQAKYGVPGGKISFNTLKPV